VTEIEIELVRAWPDRCESLRLRLPEGSRVGDALQRASEQGFAAALESDPKCLAVFGRNATPATRLYPGDRIELLRPLLADPKERRRERAGKHKP
jgi:putative ubiquitin-RnfH superfamily antitoxin RatB of RatAB toxin-antitoxin module